MDLSTGNDNCGSEIYGITISEKKGPLEIFLRAELLGNDLLVTIWGGAAHIGAVAMAVPRPSLRDPNKLSATSSVFTFVGHKEDVTVKILSEGISAGLNRNVVAVGGIHWDGLTGDDIRWVVEACETLKEKLLRKMRETS